jgi:hypothetical protein
MAHNARVSLLSSCTSIEKAGAFPFHDEPHYDVFNYLCTYDLFSPVHNVLEPPGDFKGVYPREV